MTRKDEYDDNPYYQQFLVEKNKIKERYPQELWQTPTSYKSAKIFDKDLQVLWKQYLKEVGDLMFQPNGTFQDFVWDVMSESDKNLMAHKARTNKYGRSSEFNYY